jgi:hypothetical protein
MSELLNNGAFENFHDNHLRFWDGLGFLDGIEDEHKKDLSYMFEIMAFYLVNGHKIETFGRRDLILEKTKVKVEKYDDCDNKRFEVLVFPIIRRIYCGTFAKHPYKIFDIFHMSECFRITVGTLNEEDWNTIESMHYYPIDAEAEYTAWFCSYYEEEIIGKNKFVRMLLVESKSSFLNFMFNKNYQLNKFREWQRERIMHR